MSNREQLPYGGHKYYEALKNSFEQSLSSVVKVVALREQAPIIDSVESSIEYVRLNPENNSENETAVFYVPGFTEGVIAKAPLGISLAEAGRSVIMPEQNRKGTLRGHDGKKNATYTQAIHALSIIEQEGLTDSTVDFVTHSYGSIVLDEMVREAERRGWSCFNGSKVAMLAPAGLRKEKQLSYTKRFLQDILSTGSSEKEIEDYAFKYGVKNLLRNPVRSIREVFEMRRTKLDIAQMKRLGGLASVGVLSHAEDKIFPSSVSETVSFDDTVAGSSIAEYINQGAIDSWSVPVDMAAVEDGRFTYGGEHAEHNDEQFFPRRSARAIIDLLKQ